MKQLFYYSFLSLGFFIAACNSSDNSNSKDHEALMKSITDMEDSIMSLQRNPAQANKIPTLTNIELINRLIAFYHAYPKEDYAATCLMKVHIKYSDFDIEPEYRGDWEHFNFFEHESEVKESVIRAYSMANYPDEKGVVKFNIRIATPPPRSTGIVPGQMSSYVFSLKPGDTISVYGPFGEFFAKDTPSEMVFIGGGAGMAPMRSHIFDQLKRLKSDRKISFWYGARSLRECFYDDDYDMLASENQNFDWHLALSDPQPEDNWEGYTGFIHNVLFEQYLKDHEAPEDCEYYMCGPPMMNAAVVKMLSDLGVEKDNIFLDDFGG